MALLLLSHGILKGKFLRMHISYFWELLKFSFALSCPNLIMVEKNTTAFMDHGILRYWQMEMCKIDLDVVLYPYDNDMGLHGDGSAQIS